MAKRQQSPKSEARAPKRVGKTKRKSEPSVEVERAQVEADPLEDVHFAEYEENAPTVESKQDESLSIRFFFSDDEFLCEDELEEQDDFDDEFDEDFETLSDDEFNDLIEETEMRDDGYVDDATRKKRAQGPSFPKSVDEEFDEFDSLNADENVLEGEDQRFRPF